MTVPRLCLPGRFALRLPGVVLTKTGSPLGKEGTNRLAREVLGWKPHVGLEDGLRRTIEWIKKYPERYRPNVYVV